MCICVRCTCTMWGQKMTRPPKRFCTIASDYILDGRYKEISFGMIQKEIHLCKTKCPYYGEWWHIQSYMTISRVLYMALIYTGLNNTEIFQEGVIYQVYHIIPEVKRWCVMFKIYVHFVSGKTLAAAIIDNSSESVMFTLRRLQSILLAGTISMVYT